MAGLMPLSGQKLALKWLLARRLTLRLFTNQKSPSLRDLANSYQEAIGNGYKAIPLASEDWQFPVGEQVLASQTEKVFRFSAAAGKVHGYFITDQETGALMCAEAFTDGAIDIKNNGDQIRIAPSLRGAQ